VWALLSDPIEKALPCTNTHMHTHTRTNTLTHTRTNAHTHKHTRTNTHTHTHKHTHAQAHTRTSTHTHTSKINVLGLCLSHTIGCRQAETKSNIKMDENIDYIYIEYLFEKQSCIDGD
jgi:carbohydrate-binding DOMON domain-containing protein